MYLPKQSEVIPRLSIISPGAVIVIIRRFPTTLEAPPAALAANRIDTHTRNALLHTRLIYNPPPPCRYYLR